MQIRWRKVDWQHAAMTALAAALSQSLTLAFGLTAGYWAAITAIVVIQSEAGATLVASRDRLIGTVIGALIGWAALAIWHEHVLLFALAIFLTVGICNTFNLQPAGRLAGVTVAIIVLIPRPGTPWQTASTRFIEVAIGILVALGVTALFYPRSVLQGLKTTVKPS